jgi:hypothetical protein
MEYETAGDPVSGCKWTRKTTGKIAAELKRAGIRVSVFVDPDAKQVQAAARCGAWFSARIPSLRGELTSWPHAARIRR